MNRHQITSDVNGAIWRGTDKPAGSPFHAPVSLANLPDCPFCKYGTPLRLDEKTFQCADCKVRYTAEKPHKRI
jgi:hypothetical protein